MDIIVCESGNVIQNFLKKEERFSVYSPKQYSKNSADILIIDEGCEKKYFSPPGDVVAFNCITPGNFFPYALRFFNAHNIISCGMSSKNTVTFSSIGDERCMICIQRKISCPDGIVQPSEFHSNLYKGLNLYQNLIVGTVKHLSDCGKE